MQTIKINTTDELLEFLERDDIEVSDMYNVASSFLNTIPLFFSNQTKEELRSKVKHYIERFGHLEKRPFFLEQKGEKFDIKDVYGC